MSNKTKIEAVLSCLNGIEEIFEREITCLDCACESTETDQDVYYTEEKLGYVLSKLQLLYKDGTWTYYYEKGPDIVVVATVSEHIMSEDELSDYTEGVIRQLLRNTNETGELKERIMSEDSAYLEYEMNIA